MKVYHLKFASGMIEVWKDTEENVYKVAKLLLNKYNEKFVTIFCKGRIVKTFYNKEVI